MDAINDSAWRGHRHDSSVRLAALAALATAGGAALADAPAAHAVAVKVSVEKLAPTDDTRLTPQFFAVHDGSADQFDVG